MPNAHVIACCSILGAIKLVLTVWPPKCKKKKVKNKTKIKKRLKD